jgi:hypothetical protein
MLIHLFGKWLLRARHHFTLGKEMSSVDMALPSCSFIPGKLETSMQASEAKQNQEVGSVQLEKCHGGE